MPAKEKIIVALDVPSAEAALQVAHKLHGHVGMFKVGKELFTAEGPRVARNLLAEGDRVFLDLKFHDIPNTVRARRAAGGNAGGEPADGACRGRAQDAGRVPWRASRAAAKARGVPSPRACWR